MSLCGVFLMKRQSMAFVVVIVSLVMSACVHPVSPPPERFIDVPPAKFEASDPRSALEQLNLAIAAGDEEAIRKCFHATRPQAVQLATDLARSFCRARRLNAAIDKRWPNRDATGSPILLDQWGNRHLLEADRNDLANLKLTQEGDRARAESGIAHLLNMSQLELVKSSGRWLVDLDTVPSLPRFPNISEGTAVIHLIALRADRVDRLIARIPSFQSLDQVREAWVDIMSNH